MQTAEIYSMIRAEAIAKGHPALRVDEALERVAYDRVHPDPVDLGKFWVHPIPLTAEIAEAQARDYDMTGEARRTVNHHRRNNFGPTFEKIRMVTMRTPRCLCPQGQRIRDAQKYGKNDADAKLAESKCAHELAVAFWQRYNRLAD